MKSESESLSDVPAVVYHLCPLLEWQGMSIALNMERLDRKAICDLHRPVFDFLNGPFGEYDWWTWPSRPEDASDYPIWWTAPTRYVVSCYQQAICKNQSTHLKAATSHACAA